MKQDNTNTTTWAFMMEDISKSFLNGKIKANQGITFGAHYGEVVGLVGENGAGKSTLMSILFGLYQPDEGKIKVDGKVINITSPTVANKFGIGMVPQHFKLVGNMTVTENIMLGVETTKFGILNRKVVAQKISELSAQYGLEIDPNAKIDSLSIGLKQRVEILKMLFKNSKIMVFDEPTSVLTPQEAEKLIQIVKQFKAEGKVVIFISHKLNEIIEVSDYIVVMRRGKMTGNIAKKDANPAKLSEMMVGESVELVFDNKKPFVDATISDDQSSQKIVELKNISLTKGGVSKLKNVSFSVSAKEIVGLVGIDGNGQSEVVEIVTKLEKPTSGTINLNLGIEKSFFHHHLSKHAEKLPQNVATQKIKKTIKNKSISRKELIQCGVGHIPVDRQHDGIALDMTVTENMIFNRVEKYSKFGFINFNKANKFTSEIIQKYDVRGADGGKAIIRGLSGGNQQKAVTGREVEYASKLLVAAHPTRGIDVGAIKNIYKHIIDRANSGTAVIILSGELDELIAVSHKLVVFSHGEVTGIVDPRKVSKAELGLMMTGTHYDELKTKVTDIKDQKLVTEEEVTSTKVVKASIKKANKKDVAEPKTKISSTKPKGGK